MEASKLNEINMTKYLRAASIINHVMKTVIEKCVPGAIIIDICDFGDKLILSELSKVYTKKTKGDSKIDKGIAFPVTICVNEICTNYTPSDKSEILKEGDVVKINMGCHIDGHIAVIGHTIYVSENKENIIEGTKGHILKCAYILSSVLMNSMKVGTSFLTVAKDIEKACNDLDCTILSQCYTYQMKKYVYEGSKYITLVDSPELKQEKHKIEDGEIYLVDITVTSGEDKLIKSDFKTNIYKRDVTNHYELRTNLGRSFMQEVDKRFPVLPFHLRYLEDQRAALIGIPEALKHGLFKPYVVQCVKKNDVVVQFKYTVIAKEEGLKIITGIEFSQLGRCKMNKEITQGYLLDILKSDFFTKPKPVANKSNVENGDATQNCS